MLHAAGVRSALRKVTIAGIVAIVAATLLGNAPAQAAERLKPQYDESVAGNSAPSSKPKRLETGKPYAPKPPKWPLGVAHAKIKENGPVRAGNLPIYFDRPAKAGRTAGAGVGQAKVEALDRAQAAKAKVDGVLLRVQRMDGRPEAGAVRVSVNYEDFASAYGADWANRLALVELPECALSTPDAAECAGKPLASTNDNASKSVSADVVTTREAGVLVAATAAPSGSTGSFTATSLQPSSTWSAGGNSGNFSWSYPMRVPPAPGGLAPQVSLSYSSQSVDGRMAASNNQPSWIGEGFDYNPGFIERRYKPCDKDVSGDLCQVTDNATLSLNGSSTELIYEEGKGWHGRAEDGSRVERKTGIGNGDDNGEHWVVTAPNGTQYWFGLSPAGNSTWTVPVKVGGAWTTQAWRWNLDYVVDTHGNTMTLHYQKETNKYARNASPTDLVEYVRGGYLTRIDYGTRDGATGSAPIQVVFDVADRCVTANCGTHDAANWPDVPWDQECVSGSCYNGAPTFWTTKRLSKVTTKLRTDTGSSYRDVESWTFHHTFPDPGDGTRAGLWLDRISHSGTGGIALPDVQFKGVQLPNRVDAIDHSPAMNWWRIAEIHTETGGSINVSYSGQQCVAGSVLPGALESNGLRCYPVRWTPSGHTSPITDWFHKYVVTAVTESDDAADGIRVVNKYEYVGDPAWHYTDDDGLIEPEDKTWSVWRGYGKVRSIKGDPADEQVTETTFFRGMHGDKLPSGNRSVQLPAAGGAAAVNDEDAYGGMVRESVVLNGAAEVSGQVNVPRQSDPTASRTINDTTVHARFTGIEATHSRAALDGGRGNRTSSVYRTFDEHGMVVKTEDTGDSAVVDDSQCVLTDYVRNTTDWIMDRPSRVRTSAVGCAAAEAGGLDESQVISDIRTSYDSADFGVAPTKGDVTRVESLKTLTEYQTTGTSRYDDYGRVIEVIDIKGNKTTTAYTHNAGGQLASTKVTNHLGWENSTTVEPSWGIPLKITDQNGRVTDVDYDGLGRTTAVWLPGRSKASHTPSMTYEYLVRNDAPTVVTTKKLTPSEGYVTSRVLFDGLLRTRQTQTPEAGTAGGRIITDTIYDSAGRAFQALGPYVADGAPDTSLFKAIYEEAIAQQTLTKFDGAGRPVETIFRPKGVAKYSTFTNYGGDRVDVTPPAGGTATSTVTDIRGRVVELRQYKGATPTGENDATTYTFNGKGQQTAVKDPAGNQWTYEYDLLGRQKRTVDPDKGETTSVYNDFSELVSTTDARGETLAYGYDTLGRKVSMHDDTLDGPKRAEWVYDTLVKGKPTKSIHYDGDNAYVNEVVAYNTAYQPSATRISIPASETGLAGTYTYMNTYHPDGSLKTSRLPAVGGLAVETLTYGYTPTGLPSTVQTNVGSTSGTFGFASAEYTRYGELGVLKRRYASSAMLYVDQGFYYEEDTRRLRELYTVRQKDPGLVSQLNYTYDDAGNILSQADNTAGVEETQCYRYDYLRRLTDAWTPSSRDCATEPSSALGGPAPYWTSWEFDAVGNRKTQVEHATAHGDRTTTYTYPAAHQLASTSTTDSAGSRESAFTYDAAGNTLTRDGKELGWDAEGRLATNDGSSYVYDADGNRLIARDGNGKTLYLPGQELRYNNSGTKVGTRYYSFGGQTIGQRVGSTVTWLINDRQGSAQVSVAESTQAITRRYQTPYGSPRGPQPSWSNDKGFVGGTNDPTGLIHLGAREYDPVIGRFISVDPIMDLADPQQWNAYTYANGSPITKSDPSGLRPECGGGTGNYTCNNDVPKANGDGHWHGGTTINVEYTGEDLRQYRAYTRSLAEENRCNESFWCRNRSRAEQHWNKLNDAVYDGAQWVRNNREDLLVLAVHLIEIEIGLLLIEGGAGLTGGGLVLDLTGVGAIIGIPASAVGVAAIAGGVGLVGHGGLGAIDDVNRMLSKKTTRGSGKDRATDVPSWAKGSRKYADETPDQAVQRIFRENGKDVPPPSKRGPGSEYSKIRKFVTRR